MKKVGIILRDDYLSFRKSKMLNSEIVEYLKDCLLVGIIVDFNNDSSKEFLRVQELIDECDGIILQGGSEMYPIDLEIVKYLYDRDISTLGICLGMQIMGVVINGELSSNSLISHKSNKKYVHSISIKEDSKLYSILNNNKIEVNSRHKDYLIKTDLDIGGYSDDDIIEAIEDKNKKFFVGVEWHPESLNDEYSNKLFNSFVDSL